MKYSIPYIINDSDQDVQIQEEIETASMLLIAMSRQGNRHPDAIVKVHYPFKFYESKEGNILFGLLGQYKTEKKWLIPKDTLAILEELEGAENSDQVLGLINKGKDLMNEDPEYGSIWINGMIEQEDVKAFILGNIHENESKEEGKPDLFQPILTSRKFSSTRKNIKSVLEEIENNIQSAGQETERIEHVYEVIKKNHEKKLSAFKKESEKRLDDSKKDKENAIKNVEKSLKKETKAINNEFKALLLQKTNEMDAIKDAIAKLEEKLEIEIERDDKRRLASLKKQLNGYNKEIQVLQDEHRRSLSNAENEAESDRNHWEEKYRTMINEENFLLEKLLEKHERTLSGCMELKNGVSSMTATMTKNAESLSKILEIKYGKGKDLYMPFYIFRYGEDDFGFYPPVKFSEEKNMRKMLKLFITGDMGNKIGQFISPQTDIFDGTLEMVMESIKDKNELSKQFEKSFPSSNLLESREALDKMAVGLYQIMEWTWISQSDYIEVQRFLLEKLDNLNGGNVFNVKIQEIDEVLETPEAMEIPVTE